MIQNYKNKNHHTGLGGMPVADIGHYPTPLVWCSNISKKYGVDVYIKREDLSGPGFGGNKVRKLRYLLGEALKINAGYVLTYGAHQTNHGRETAACCRLLGLKPVLFLASPSPSVEYLGNLLLDEILGCEIHLVPANPGSGAYQAMKKLKELAGQRIAEIEKSGDNCYEIPPGGMTALGCLGFVEGFYEILDQAKTMNIFFDYIAHPTGTGGTLAGLLAGKLLTGSTVDIISYSVDQEPEDKPDIISAQVLEILKLLDQPLPEIKSIRKEINLQTGYYGQGYEKPTQGATKAIRELAREEGIFLDPVYTGKAMHGLLDAVKKRKIKQGSAVLFIHTGGGPALFAENQITGNLLSHVNKTR